MTIIEAIKSGKPFKRKAWEFYLTTNNESQIKDKDGDLVSLDVKDILTDDWVTLNTPGIISPAALRDSLTRRGYGHMVNVLFEEFGIHNE